MSNKQIPKKGCGNRFANDNRRPQPPHEVMKADLIEAGYGDLLAHIKKCRPEVDEETTVSELHAFY